MKTDSYKQFEHNFGIGKYNGAVHDMSDVISIDLVDACNLRCVTCPRGLQIMKNNQGQMDFNLYKRIINKAKKIGFKHLNLYSWTEPFLCHNISNYIHYAKDIGLSCALSSNLSFYDIPDLIQALRYADKLIISLSGFTQQTYSVHHRGGNINLVKSNIEKIAAAKKKKLINAKIIIYYFNYPYTIGEFQEFKKYADELDIEVYLWKGGGNPLLEKRDSYNMVKNYHCVKNCCSPSPSWSACISAVTGIPINWKGDVYLCCLKVYEDSTRIGNFIDDEFDLLQYRRVTHGACKECKFKNPVDLAPNVITSLSNGMCIEYSDLKAVRNTRGRDIFFYGYGEMYHLKKDMFNEANPLGILADIDGCPEFMDGLRIYRPEEKLPYVDPVPIVIFAGREAGEIIKEKILSCYPQFNEVYFWSD